MNDLNNSVTQKTRLFGKSDTILSIIGMLACLAIFGIVMFVAYLPTRPPAVDHTIAAGRSKRLAALQAKETETYNSYGWIDKPAGVLHIPVERAVAVFVQEQQEIKKEPNQ
jgi:hypothetical protein